MSKKIKSVPGKFSRPEDLKDQEKADVISVRITKELKTEIEKIASRANISISKLVTKVLEEYVVYLKDSK